MNCVFQEGRGSSYSVFRCSIEAADSRWGTLSGEVVSLTPDNKISGNSDNAALFGISNTKMRFTSTPFMAASSLPDLNLTIDGTDYVVSMDAAGQLASTPALPTGVSIVSSVTAQLRGELLSNTIQQSILLYLTNPRMHWV